eukprot:scpid71757/ scgid1516/ Mannose-P-dolichol utilization defect 1 protein; Suppressor of Lec15 and Lec35 glycosylation mutation
MDLLAVSKLLGVVTIVMCSVMKLPQLWLIVKSKKAQGISLSSLSMELFCDTCGLLYGFCNGYPLTTYGESVLLVLQSICLHAFVIHYEGLMSWLIALAGLLYPLTVHSLLIGTCTSSYKLQHHSYTRHWTQPQTGVNSSENTDSALSLSQALRTMHRHS